MRYGFGIALLCAGCLIGDARGAAEAAVSNVAASHQFFRVTLGAAFQKPASGRLLVFASEAKAAEADVLKKSDGKSSKVEQVDADPVFGTPTSVAAREIGRWVPGQAQDVDGDAQAFPAGLSSLPPGDYYVQAVLDVDHSYNYTGRGGGDLISEVVKLHLPSNDAPRLALTKALPADDPWAGSEEMSPAQRAALPDARVHTKTVDFVSPSLSAFWGRPTHMRARVLLPPDYAANAAARWPTVYWTHGFGDSGAWTIGALVDAYDAMAARQTPPMIWVFLDQSSATGTHEFADSVNNGPWGHALTAELIPELEAHYRMDARANDRLLTGHSSGGWATLWLQTHYPKLFGGAWSTAPDPSDFHDFNGIDLYAPNANVYHRADGSAYPLVRWNGKLISTFERFAKLEDTLGAYGGQLASFDWVFSPRGKDGRPLPMYDRNSGDVDPAVVAYWRDHYDIAYWLQQNWPSLKPDLDGKIHLYIGTEDNFYLQGSAYRLKAVLDGLHAATDFRFLEGRDHIEMLKVGDDPNGLLKQIAWQMYAVARPASELKAPAPAK